jgi:hypothetical protein
MNAAERAQVRLILETLSELASAGYREKLEQIHAAAAAKGMSRDSSLINDAMRAMEEVARQLVKDSVDQVAPVSMSIAAFAMLSETVELHLTSLRPFVDRVVAMVAGSQPDDRLLQANAKMFDELASRVKRQLELHRFTFTRASSPILALNATAAPIAQKAQAKGGRPPAEFWDDMWAAIAAMLYDGSLQPKSQATIEKAMSDWIIAHGWDAGTTSVRARARRLWTAIESSDD